MIRRIWILFAVLASTLTLGHATSAYAQSLSPRFGLGIGTMLTTQQARVGIGFRVRASVPVNADLSFGVDAGAVGFVFAGREEASIVLDPQVSVIVTIRASDTASPYIIGGMGGYIPFGKEAKKEDGGPTLHAGIGWVKSLTDTSLYFEVNPTLVIAQSSTHLVLPIRLGIVL